VEERPRTCPCIWQIKVVCKVLEAAMPLQSQQRRILIADNTLTKLQEVAMGML
jgi:hypothetical protein